MDYFNPTENEVFSETEDTFPAYRYWLDGEVFGDNLDVYLSVTYGDPEVVGIYPADDYWEAEITKEGVTQYKKFVVNEYQLEEGEEPPFSEHPSVVEDFQEVTPNTPDEPEFGEEEEGVETTPDEPDYVDDTVEDPDDVVVESGSGAEIDYGTELEDNG